MLDQGQIIASIELGIVIAVILYFIFKSMKKKNKQRPVYRRNRCKLKKQ